MGPEVAGVVAAVAVATAAVADAAAAAGVLDSWKTWKTVPLASSEEPPFGAMTIDRVSLIEIDS